MIMIFGVFGKTLNTFTRNSKCHTSMHHVVYTQLYDLVLYTQCIICGYIFLTMLYLYHDPSRKTFRSPISRDYLNGAFLMNLAMLCDIFGNPLPFSVDSDRFEDFFEEPDQKFLRLHDVIVYYVNDTDRDRIRDRYKNTYKKLHFRRIPERKKLSKNGNAKSQPSTDFVTCFICIQQVSFNLINYSFTENYKMIA